MVGHQFHCSHNCLHSVLSNASRSWCQSSLSNKDLAMLTHVQVDIGTKIEALYHGIKYLLSNFWMSYPFIGKSSRSLMSRRTFGTSEVLWALTIERVWHSEVASELKGLKALINGIDSVLKPMPSSTLYHQMFVAMKVNMFPRCAQKRFHHIKDDIPKTVNVKKDLSDPLQSFSWKPCCQMSGKKSGDL